MADAITDNEVDHLTSVAEDTDYIYDADSKPQKDAVDQYYDRVLARLRMAKCTDNSVSDMIARMTYAPQGIDPDTFGTVGAVDPRELKWNALVMAVGYLHNTTYFANSFTLDCLRVIKADAPSTSRVVLALGIGDREWQLRDHDNELGDVTLVVNGSDDNFGHFATKYTDAATELCPGVQRVVLPSKQIVYETRDDYDGCMSLPFVGMLRAVFDATHVSVVCGVDLTNCRSWHKAARKEGMVMPWLYVHGTDSSNSQRRLLGAPVFTPLDEFLDKFSDLSVADKPSV